VSLSSLPSKSKYNRKWISMFYVAFYHVSRANWKGISSLIQNQTKKKDSSEPKLLKIISLKNLFQCLMLILKKTVARTKQQYNVNQKENVTCTFLIIFSSTLNACVDNSRLTQKYMLSHTRTHTIFFKTISNLFKYERTVNCTICKS